MEQRANTEDNQKDYSKCEYSYSSFVHSFTLPESADFSKIDANYTDGILRIDIAKREEAKSCAGRSGSNNFVNCFVNKGSLLAVVL